MSIKKQNLGAEISTEKVDEITQALLIGASGELEEVYSPPKPVLDALGREVVNPISLVTGAATRRRTLGDQVRRYIATPRFLSDQELGDYDPDELEEALDLHENPMSQYEDRAEELRQRIRARKEQEREREKQERIDQDNAAQAEWEERYEKRRRAAAVPPTDHVKDEA